MGDWTIAIQEVDFNIFPLNKSPCFLVHVGIPTIFWWVSSMAAEGSAPNSAGFQVDRAMQLLEEIVNWQGELRTCFRRFFEALLAGWWFQTCFIFHNIWDNPSH